MPLQRPNTHTAGPSALFSMHKHWWIVNVAILHSSTQAPAFMRRQKMLGARVFVCERAQHTYSSVFKCVSVCEWMSLLSSRMKMCAERRGGTLPLSAYWNEHKHPSPARSPPPLVFSSLGGWHCVAVTHMLSPFPGCICGAVLWRRILIPSGCLLRVVFFFNYLFLLLFECYANVRAVWMRCWTLQHA